MVGTRAGGIKARATVVDWEETVRAYMEEPTLREVARRLGVTANVASSRLSRIREAGVTIPLRKANPVGGVKRRPIPVDELNKIVAQYDRT